jgi:tRNA (cmo5U34)-methyltransferase
MSEFDKVAADWDNNPVHINRSEAIAESIKNFVPLHNNMNALEYGAGTGLLSFFLADRLKGITLMDNSKEMVSVVERKIKSSGMTKFEPLFFDLEHNDYSKQKFDFIFSQMVLHHVSDVNQLIRKFYGLLNPGGYLAIADLYKEDGSFHGEHFTGHKGFDVENLKIMTGLAGFFNIRAEPCYTLTKPTDKGIKEYPIFLLVGCK